MKRNLAPALAGLLLAALAAAGCDKSRQSADGSVAQDDAGVAAATGNGSVASTGSPEMNGANGSGPPQVPANATINAQDRATPDAQSPGKANAAANP